MLNVSRYLFHSIFSLFFHLIYEEVIGWLDRHKNCNVLSLLFSRLSSLPLEYFLEEWFLYLDDFVNSSILKSSKNGHSHSCTINSDIPFKISVIFKFCLFQIHFLEVIAVSQISICLRSQKVPKFLMLRFRDITQPWHCDSMIMAY